MNVTTKGKEVRDGCCLESRTVDVAALYTEIKHLKQQLVKKENENARILRDKDKLEEYANRMTAKLQDKYLPTLQECKAKLAEKAIQN